MFIQFKYHGATYKADLAKQDDEKLIVLFNDAELQRQFGSSLPFYVHDHTVDFQMLNRSHSDLYALNSSVCNAIREQCKGLL